MFNEKIRKSDENITSDIMPNQIWGIDEGLYKYPYLLISFSFFFKFLFLFSGLGFFFRGGGVEVGWSVLLQDYEENTSWIWIQ